MIQSGLAQAPQAKLNDFRGAIADFTTATGNDPDDSGAYCNRGGATLRLKQNDSGCLDFSKAGEIGFGLADVIIQKYGQ